MKAPAIQVQNEDQQTCPDDEALQQWASAALTAAGADTDAEITIRIVGEQEMLALNQQYRHQGRVTNVLSFAADLPTELQLPLLGDIIICAPVVEREAGLQAKTASAHWAHMVVHGTLHLLGYDHLENDEAEAMEQLETRVLDKLHFAPPYEDPRQSSERPATP